MNKVAIYTDGACRGNPGPGGWGVLLRFSEGEKMLSGADANTTNNRMELMAAIKGLESIDVTTHIDLYTDSQYVQKGMSEWLSGWKRRGWKTSTNQPVKNVDLWKLLDEQTKRHHVTWHWLKGHNGHIENDRADALAREAIDRG